MIEVRGRTITFIPPKQAAYLIGDFTDWDERPIPLHEALTLEFPEGAYLEYAFLDAQMQPIADEANPLRPHHPWYEYHRACFLPGNTFRPPPRVEMLQGTLIEQSVPSKALGGSRTCLIYEPFTPPTATLFVQDGLAFAHKLAVHRVAEALVMQGRIKPVRLVFIEPAERVKEYWFNPDYESFLIEELLPLLEQTYAPTPRQGLWGASLGGLVSSWLALRHPDIFSLVISHSGCFTADPQGGNAHHDQEWLTALFAHTERLPLRFYLQTGLIEWLLAPNRRFAAMLADQGYPHLYQEHCGGHTWTTWEQGIVPALHFLFGDLS